MSTLFAALQSSANALKVFESALNVTSNNVANASTPGYARQSQGLQALPFDPTLGEVPLVQVVIDGTPHYANPNVDGAVFDDSYADNPMPAGPAVGERSLHVTLEAERTTHPGERITLLDNTWTASQVSGRNITAAFVTVFASCAIRPGRDAQTWGVMKYRTGTPAACANPP